MALTLDWGSQDGHSSVKIKNIAKGVAHNVLVRRVLCIRNQLCTIALCFLSKLNKDTYTRRCFEIPAIGSALFSEYSEYLANLFIDGTEAVFFRNQNELVEKVTYYLNHKDELEEIRKRGTERVSRDGHEYLFSRQNCS